MLAGAELPHLLVPDKKATAQNWRPLLRI